MPPELATSRLPAPRLTHDVLGGSPALPLLCAALAAAAFVGMDTVIKMLAPRHDTLQLSLFRFAGGSAFAIPLWLWKRTPLPTGHAWRLHVVRSVLLLASLLGYFFALSHLPLAMTVMVSYLSPIFVAVLAGPVLGERPAPAVWLALVVGLAGVSIAVWPELQVTLAGGASGRLPGMASAAIAALSFAGVLLLARRQASRDAIWSILLIQSVLPMLMLAGPAAWHWAPVSVVDIGWALFAGGLGTLGLLGMTYAFTHLEASRVASLDYSGFVWAAALGYFLFDEVPSATTWAAAALIIGGCAMLLRRG